ncbi:hypothetical protein [Frankia sp. AgB32]|uniref:hypothetical protein n=1 Tax=Frankia sp. AgB32 TaxID=631119 RepID=UPI00200D8642|nr:hypothetical protein [Frankia sp. AgB32]MCK9895073.1 hypothetical protein [Frankia sp. AgB32]
MRARRSSAVSRLVWQLVATVLAVALYGGYQPEIESFVAGHGHDGWQVYRAARIMLPVVVGLFLVDAVRAVIVAGRQLRSFRRPYQQARAEQQRRHQEAVEHWEQAWRRHDGAAAAHRRAVREWENGPRWHPVRPVVEPTRVDVFGGDPQRHGWASLLVTLGCSVLAAGHRITVLDFTGQDVGGGLTEVALASGRQIRMIRLGSGSAGRAVDRTVDLLGQLRRREVAEVLGQALASRPEGDRREERASATDVLRRVVDSLDGPPSFARLAAGVRVLRRGDGAGSLSAKELGRLADQIGDVDQDEWTSRQLRFLASQLDQLHDMVPGPVAGQPASRALWPGADVSVVATGGGRDDRKELLDRLLVQMARQAMGERTDLDGFLVVAGGDHLGAGTLRDLSEHARWAGLRLVLMVDQPQGDLEKSAGTGGAVVFMKMYNHRDAAIAAEFIGKGHRFVVNQVTRQVGTSFNDGGGDSFTTNTNDSASGKQRSSGLPGRRQSLSDSRGHAWAGTRNWSIADNISTSTVTGRVYEFVVEPREILTMPQSAFILIDNSTHGRRMIMADSNPGIALLDRVATAPVRR